MVEEIVGHAVIIAFPFLNREGSKNAKELRLKNQKGRAKRPLGESVVGLERSDGGFHICECFDEHVESAHLERDTCIIREVEEL